MRLKLVLAAIILLLASAAWGGQLKYVVSFGPSADLFEGGYANVPLYFEQLPQAGAAQAEAIDLHLEFVNGNRPLNGFDMCITEGPDLPTDWDLSVLSVPGCSGNPNTVIALAGLTPLTTGVYHVANLLISQPAPAGSRDISPQVEILAVEPNCTQVFGADNTVHRATDNPAPIGLSSVAFSAYLNPAHATLQFDKTVYSVQRGETFQLDVQLNADEWGLDLTGVQFTFGFDNTFFECTSGAPGADIPQDWWFIGWCLPSCGPSGCTSLGCEVGNMTYVRQSHSSMGSSVVPDGSISEIGTFSLTAKPDAPIGNTIITFVTGPAPPLPEGLSTDWRAVPPGCATVTHNDLWDSSQGPGPPQYKDHLGIRQATVTITTTGGPPPDEEFTKSADEPMTWSRVKRLYR